MNTTLTNYLKAIIKNEPDTIRAFIAYEALYSHDNPALFFKDLSTYGCISGMVSSLIYYTDTHEFFDHYYAEIGEIREDYKNNIGELIEISGDLKNNLSWFAFEYRADEIYTTFLELNREQ